MDQNECADDSTCEHGCQVAIMIIKVFKTFLFFFFCDCVNSKLIFQNFMGSYRCGCPEGFVQHLYYNQCIDENECNTSPCGDNTCINTIGSYKCGCPDGYQFDGNLQICVQVSFRFRTSNNSDRYLIEKKGKKIRCTLGERRMHWKSLRLRLHP